MISFFPVTLLVFAAMSLMVMYARVRMRAAATVWKGR